MDTTEPTYPGRRYGLPAAGIGSVAGQGRRFAAFGIDIALSFVIALLFSRPELPRNWSVAVWAVITVLSVAVFGSTPGQWALGLRVAPLGGRSLVGWWALPRTALIFFLVPPLLVDRDGRGLHDRLCRTVVITTR